MLRVSKLKYMNNLMNGNIEEIENRFITVVANPPYSTEWDPHTELLKYDDRFKDYGKLAPAKKADYAFVQHMIYHLDDNGTMAVVLPHGVLFRGAAEGVIRQYLIKEKNYLDAIIGLPSNLFFGTSIPTSILVFKKCREDDDNVLFIDASQSFEKGKNQNLGATINQITTGIFKKMPFSFPKKQEEQKMDRITADLSEQFAKSKELEDQIRKSLEGLGYGV